MEDNDDLDVRFQSFIEQLGVVLELEREGNISSEAVEKIKRLLEYWGGISENRVEDLK